MREEDKFLLSHLDFAGCMAYLLDIFWRTGPLGAMEILLRNAVIWVIFPLLLGTSIYFTFRLHFPQFCRIGGAFKMIVRSQTSTGQMGSFAAVATIIGGNLGAGTIAGSAMAVSMGGAGAIFWMVAVAILGSVIKLASAALGVFYQEKFHDQCVGGAMIYIRKGLNSPFLGFCYCLCLVGASLTVGNLVQVHAFTASFTHAGVFVRFWGVLLLMLPAVPILFGGLKRLSIFMSASVPVIGIAYIVFCIVGIVFLRDNLGPVIRNIFCDAFSWNAAGGGATGFFFARTLQAGISRGLFATDIGLGLVAIAHGRIERENLSIAEHARRQGLIALIAPILVAILCAMTGILVLCAAPNLGSNATQICIDTFSRAFSAPRAGYLIIPFVVYCFALTTITAWAWFAEHAFKDPRWITAFRIFFIAAMPMGALVHGTLPWQIADVCIDGLLLTNLFALLRLRSRVAAIYNYAQ
ncbi:MAG: alanine:cation symporter family protein [Puniceicoccales bacterium]|jgi:Na+/alanine symporter|nr:alanine:cation symporter family protein [Puniceicoccales bacterium]